MEIPKSKVLIYVLTFLCYSYSGYGTSVLTQLKDAVIAAEGFFSGVLTKVVDVVTKVKIATDTFDSSLDEECTWSCPGGVKAVKNKYYKPTSNGCGPEELDIGAERFAYPGMTECCDAHDICYATCNSDKDKCDLDFRRCLYKSCQTVNPDDLMKCKMSAKLMYTSSATLGCKYYQDAQSLACYCSGSKKKKYSADEL